MERIAKTAVGAGAVETAPQVEVEFKEAENIISRMIELMTKLEDRLIGVCLPLPAAAAPVELKEGLVPLAIRVSVANQTIGAVVQRMDSLLNSIEL